MNLKLKRIDPLQAGKLLGVFYASFSLLVIPCMVFFFALGSFAAKAQGGPPPPGMGMFLGLGAFGLLLLPVAYGAMGFIFGALAAWLYNLLARWLGGLKLEFESETPPPV